MARTVALVGALHPAARELALALEDDPGVERVLGLSRHEPPLLGPKFEFVQAGPGDPTFAPALTGAAQEAAAALTGLDPAAHRASKLRAREGTLQAVHDAIAVDAAELAG